MEMQLKKVGKQDLELFIREMQAAFQKGFEEVYGKTDELVLPQKDIEQSLNEKGAVAYQAALDGRLIGGAVVTTDPAARRNSLELLFVRCGMQNQGIGAQIWDELERRYPEALVWEICTPYFDRRNIHFYINICGFHAVEFFNERHPMPDRPEDFIGDGNQGMFLFRKERGETD